MKAKRLCYTCVATGKARLIEPGFFHAYPHHQTHQGNLRTRRTRMTLRRRWVRTALCSEAIGENVVFSVLPVLAAFQKRDLLVARNGRADNGESLPAGINLLNRQFFYAPLAPFRRPVRETP